MLIRNLIVVAAAVMATVVSAAEVRPANKGGSFRTLRNKRKLRPSNSKADGGGLMDEEDVLFWTHISRQMQGSMVS